MAESDNIATGILALSEVAKLLLVAWFSLRAYQGKTEEEIKAEFEAEAAKLKTYSASKLPEL